MMKKVILSLCMILFAMICSHAQKHIGKNRINGLYLIVNIDTVNPDPGQLKTDEAVLRFSPLFDEFNEEKATRIIVNTKEYVPLELERSPVAEQQTEKKKKLLLYLTPDASEKLKRFSAKHVMQRVAIVVDGEVLTMHKIKEPITSGQLQITRCNDNACERLFVQLKNNVKQ